MFVKNIITRQLIKRLPVMNGETIVGSLSHADTASHPVSGYQRVFD